MRRSSPRARAAARRSNRADAIERSTRRELAKKNRSEALEWAERARELDPSRVEAWDLIVALNWDLGNDDGAIARCREAAQRFPEFQSELDRLKAEQAKRDRRTSPQGRTSSPGQPRSQDGMPRPGKLSRKSATPRRSHSATRSSPFAPTASMRW